MRPCENCGDALPPTSRSTRKFCSVRCKNQAGVAGRVRWAKANPEATRRISTRWQRENREKVAQTMHAYYLANTERFAAARYSRRRRAEADARLVTERDWARLVARYGAKCAYCQEKAPLTRDHIVPLSRGGRHAIGNLIPACRPCNGSKGARLLVEWRASRTP